MKIFLTLAFLLTLSTCTTADVNDASRTAASGACTGAVGEGTRAIGAGGPLERIAASAVSRVISSTACR